jgi:2-C-methyl-D-erythritol 4-phosphate cytidylyltransferase
MKTIAIIPAGGKGKRFDESLPKQYHLINGKEILVYTLEVFQRCSLIDEIIISAQQDFFSLIKKLKAKYKITKLKKIVKGGKNRQNSVYNALAAAKAEDDDLIAVHDAARPLLPDKLLSESLISAKKSDNILVALKARDTIIQADEFIETYIERENVYYAQTPQVFRYKILKEAMELARKNKFYGTDESMLVTRAGYKVKIIEGSQLNIKITRPEDLEIIRSIIRK